MVSNLKSRIAVVACIAMLTLSMVVIGCGSSEDKRSDDVSFRVRRESKPVEQPPAPDKETTLASTEQQRPIPSVPEPPREVTYEEAEAAFNEKRYDEAADLFAEYTDRKTENPWGYYMLGLSAWKAGDHENAEEAFEQALELDPNHVKSWLNLSRVLLDTSRPEEALTKIEEALAKDPQSNVAYRLKGRALHQMGRNEEAIEANRQAIRIDGQDAWAMNNMALVLIEEGRFDEALPPLACAVGIRDDIAVFRNNLGMALEHTGHLHAAEEAYGAAVEIDKMYEKAYANLVRIEGVEKEPDLDPVDLAAIARSFIEGIESWNAAVGDDVPLDSLDTALDSLVVGVAGVIEPDTTGGVEKP
ncbi:MAG: tetratricopeptide repeat protein [bacterium]|nr:MAG: tetratricopeptide repeat protein [bacterium]